MMDDNDALHGGNGKNKPSPPRRRRCRYCCSGATAATLVLILLTNAISIAVVSSSSGAGATTTTTTFLRRYYTKPAATLIRLWDTTTSLQTDLNATQTLLAAGRADLAGLHARLRTANELLRTLLLSMHATTATAAIDCGGWKRELAGELKIAVVGGAAMGHACVRVQDDLEKYMAYVPGGECPSDHEALLEHKLLLAGCDPLPRRRCRPPRPPKVVAAAVAGKDDRWWEQDDGALSYSMEAVLRTRPNGTVRTGLDLGGGGGNGGAAAAAAGTFAARMMDLAGATVLTAAVNAGGEPVVAARGGVVPLHYVAAARGRLPLLDGSLDIVHAGGRDLAGAGGEEEGGGVVILEFALYDVYRVLRPGGLFWLDHFVCDYGGAGGGAKQVNKTLVPLVDRVGFRKLRWNTGRGKEKKKEQWYVSALLEKPMA